MKAIIQRLLDNGIQTTGLLKILRDDQRFESDSGNLNGAVISVFHTLELPYKGNQRQVSCVPVGSYKVRKRYSEKYQEHFHLTNVPGRDYILIHSGNYHTQILGCILVGTGLKDINHDGQKDVTESRAAMKQLNELLPDEFELEIVNTNQPV